MPDIKRTYTIDDIYKTCIFVDVDDNGNIIESYTGRNVIPYKQFDFFFLDESYVGESIRNYKVVMVGFKAELKAIDLELEAELKEAYYSVMEG